jgi:orotidine-5'-phosphate decarboxylase
MDPALCRLKVGKELFTACGPALVEKLMHLGFDIFLDLKFHDIPNTVAKACRVAAQMGVWMVDVHALGGGKMMAAAKEAVMHVARPPILVGITVLTSMDTESLAALGLPTADILVPKLAKLAQESGLDGVVCSAQEAASLRTCCGADFTLVTPGIRPAGSAADDQVRIMTPQMAMAAGASYLVIGRPITQSADPRQTVVEIFQSIQG